MKYTIFFLFFTYSLTAQVTYSIDSIGTNADGTLFAIKSVETLPNGQTNTTYTQGEYDTTALTDYLLSRAVTKYRQASTRRVQAFLADREANQLRILAQNYIDSTFFAYTQRQYAAPYEAQGDLPNFMLRVGGERHYLRGFIANNLFRVERVSEDGTRLDQRDIAAMYWTSNKGIRLQPLDVTNETVFLDELFDTNRARVFWGELSDGTIVTLAWLKLR